MTHQVRSLEEAEIHIEFLHNRTVELERRIRELEDWVDTFIATPAWKRWLFIFDGWSGHRVMDSPHWRPWRKWWKS